MNNLELKVALISMVQQLQYRGTLLGSKLTLSIFLEVSETLKLNEVSTNAIRLRLFSSSFRDKARAWLHF